MPRLRPTNFLGIRQSRLQEKTCGEGGIVSSLQIRFVRRPLGEFILHLSIIMQYSQISSNVQYSSYFLEEHKGNTEIQKFTVPKFPSA